MMAIEKLVRSGITEECPEIQEILVIKSSDYDMEVSIGTRKVTIQFMPLSHYYIFTDLNDTFDACIDVDHNPEQIVRKIICRLMCKKILQKKQLTNYLLVIAIVLFCVSSILYTIYTYVQQSLLFVIVLNFAYIGGMWLIVEELPKKIYVICMNRQLKKRLAKRAAIQCLLHALPVPIRREYVEHIPKNLATWE